MTHFQRGRRQLLAAGGALALPALPLLAFTQDPAAWPERPVKLIVPFAPGGPTDTIARLVADRLRELWKQPVVVDYKPGGGTIMGTQFMASATPDGYTLGMAISAFMINPALYPSPHGRHCVSSLPPEGAGLAWGGPARRPGLPYNTQCDLTGVSQIALAHYGVFAHPSMPFDDTAGLIAYAKKNPGKLSYATPGVGTGTHLAGEMLNHMAGIDMVHIPYKGSAPAQQDVIGGRVPLLFDVLFSAMPFVRDKRLKPIGLASPRRAASEPSIGLIADALPGFSAMSYIGVIAPAGVPPALVRRIGADIAQAVKSPALTERMAQLGTEAVGSTPEAYNAVIATEIDKWTKVVRDAHIKPD